MFFLGTMRRWNIGMNLCQSLLLSHFGGALLAFFVVLLFIPSAESAASSLDASYDSDASPIVQSVFAVLNVGGCIVFFSVIAACLSASLAWMPDVIRASFHGILEIAGGVHALSTLPLSTHAQGLLLAAATGFSGFSILAQNAMFLKDCGIKLSHLMLLALLRSVLSVCLMALILKIL